MICVSSQESKQLALFALFSSFKWQKGSRSLPSILGSLIGIDRLSLQISQNPMYLKAFLFLLWSPPIHFGSCIKVSACKPKRTQSPLGKATATVARAAWTVSLKHQPHSSRLHLLHSAAWPCKTLAKSVRLAICRLSALLLRLCFGCGEFKFAQDQLAPLPLQNLKMSWCLVLHTLHLTSQVTAHRSRDKMKNAPQ